MNFQDYIKREGKFEIEKRALCGACIKIKGGKRNGRKTS